MQSDPAERPSCLLLVPSATQSCLQLRMRLRQQAFLQPAAHIRPCFLPQGLIVARANLKARDYQIDLAAKLNKTQVGGRLDWGQELRCILGMATA